MQQSSNMSENIQMEMAATRWKNGEIFSQVRYFKCDQENSGIGDSFSHDWMRPVLVQASIDQLHHVN